MNVPSWSSHTSVVQASDDLVARQLYAQMRARLQLGERMQKELIEKVSNMVIRDRLVAPSAMDFLVNDEKNTVRLQYKDGALVDMHRHALGQLCAKVKFPMVYLNELDKLEDRANDPLWRLKQLADCLNGHYKKGYFSEDSRFLHRLVGDQLRGFLSRRFNRHLASAPLLRSFLVACEDVKAHAFDATTSDVKFALKCMLPFIFEPVKNEFACVGVEWANSDFGSGRMQVSLTLWMPRGDRFGILDNTLSKVHIGSVIEDSDLEISDETAKKEADAQASAIRDAVVSKLSTESVGRILKAIEMAHEEAVPWHRLRGQLSRFLGKKDIENLKEALDQQIIDLPPVPRIDGELHPTKWWAAHALGRMAGRTEDPERRLELQHAAGSFIDPFVKEEKS